MIGKIMKWIALVLIVSIIGIAIYFAVGYAVKTKILELKIGSKGVKMQKNEWREFDLNNVPGETPGSLFSSRKKVNPIYKYRLELMYPFDGKVGFFGGSDREQVHEECFNAKISDRYCDEKNETAYLFRTIDDGKTFTRASFGHGIAQEIKEIDGVYFLKVFEADTWRYRTYRSDDLGRTWKEIGKFYIEEIFTKDRFIYTVVKSITIGKREYSYYYTKDGGKTANKLSEELQDLLLNESYSHTTHNGKLVVYQNGHLLYIDMDTNKTQTKEIEIPQKTTFRSINVDKKSNELYLKLMNHDAKEINRYRMSIYYPFSDTHVEFDEDGKIFPNKDVFLTYVDDDYIGAFVRYKGILTHIWTMNKGEKWDFEVLPHYFWNTAFTKVGNKRIYMEAIVQAKKGVENGSYLIIGKIKTK
ncbi:MAG: hypothetical protein L3J42_03640 [Hydrogenimonas sp.]|nr:hypothetical protein [Hydrogenimonas sp.]